MNRIVLLSVLGLLAVTLAFMLTVTLIKVFQTDIVLFTVITAIAVIIVLINPALKHFNKK